MRAAVLLLILAACGHPAKEKKYFTDRYFSGGDASRVQCSLGADKTHKWTHAELREALEHARTAGLVLHTYGHAPTIDLAEYVADFDWAAANGVRMVTFRELADGFHGAGWAFAIDDDEVDAWSAWRDLLRAHGVHLTFFVSKLPTMTPAQVAQLHALAADGHDIEAHSLTHANAVDYAASHGADAYARDEAVASKTALAAAGFAPVAFAYPFGAHTHALDAALLPQFALLRTTSAQWCLPDGGSDAPR